MPESKAKSAVFYLIAILIPLILLLMIEMVLRIIDYGEEYPLFVDAPPLHGYMQPNKKVINRFFPSPDFAPSVSPNSQYFLAEKPKDSFRIVVQGGSTAAGYPFGRWGSLSGMLQQRFKRLYPEKEIEIINTAMAAVNSYTLIDFVDEIIEIEPDLVLIYAGHNEYLGIMGVGSAFASKGGRAATLMYLKFNDIKLYRLIESLYYRWFVKVGSLQADGRSLMAKVAKEKNIAYGSDLYQQGIRQFEANLSLILDQYKTAEIPVIIGSLASNEKDKTPFSALETEKKISLSTLKKLTQEMRASRVSQLQAELKHQSADMAGGYFELANLQLLEGAADVARKNYLSAKDHDSLRFRAPESFNQVIKQFADSPSVTVVDVQESIRADTKEGIIGSKHMLEHLHPTTWGYFLLADTFAEEIVEQQLIDDSVSIQTFKSSKQLAWIEQPITKVDKILGEYQVAMLTSAYPFTSTPQKVARLDTSTIDGEAVKKRLTGGSWLEVNRKLQATYEWKKDLDESALISGLLADTLPHKYNLIRDAGLRFRQVENLPLALYYFNRAIEMKPNSISARISIAENYFLLGNRDKSMLHLDYVKKIQPNHPEMNRLINLIGTNKNAVPK